MGFAGGIRLLWDKNRASVDLISAHEHILIVTIREGFQQPWILSAIYASSKAVFREQLWQYIVQLKSCFNLPWCMVGDFNQELQSEEK